MNARKMCHPQHLPRKTCLLHVFGEPDGRGRSSFAAWRREPQQGGTLVSSFMVTNLDAYVDACRARGWRVRICSTRKVKELMPKKGKRQCH